MSAVFIDLLGVENKAELLKTLLRDQNKSTNRVVRLEPNRFRELPRSPFAYWAGDEAYAIFEKHPPFGDKNEAWAGLQTNDDFRWLRLWVEIVEAHLKSGRAEEFNNAWVPYAKGGEYSPFYSDLHLVVEWGGAGRKIKEWKINELRFGRITANNSKCWNEEKYFEYGLTWSQRSQIGLSVRALPHGSIFGIKGPSAFFRGGKEETLAFLAILNSAPFQSLVAMQMCFGSYDTGMVRNIPVPRLDINDIENLASLSVRAWKISRGYDFCNEISHAFILPRLLLPRVFPEFLDKNEDESSSIRAEIDRKVAELYGMSNVEGIKVAEQIADTDTAFKDEDIDEDDETEATELGNNGILSWAIGVAFGRFDWRLATGERAAPPEPDPFDPLPTKSPGMLADDAEPFHANQGILVDDQGHSHDLARLIEEVLTQIDTPVSDEVRRWLRKDFFAFHLQRYSKSRRKAPIYWPLSTASGSYTLWVYYPSLNNQTLFTAVNDFLDGPNGKLTQVSREWAELRMKGSSRSREEEKQYETLQTFEQELTDLRDTLLKIAPAYQPNHDDGVQITAAPLWPLFRHKSWQKVLKDTWNKLEKGDCDWAHLAMAYRQERVREKCKTDKSLAIAHGLEDLYVAPEAKLKYARGKKKIGDEL